MVSFTCYTCGQSIKMNRFRTHKCVSKGDKTGDKTLTPEPNADIEVKAQGNWVQHLKEKIKHSYSSADERLKPILDKLLVADDVPWKEYQIKDFIKRDWPQIDESLLSEVCNIILEASKEFGKTLTPSPWIQHLRKKIKRSSSYSDKRLKPILDKLLVSHRVPIKKNQLQRFIRRDWPQIDESLLSKVCNVILEAGKQFKATSGPSKWVQHLRTKIQHSYSSSDERLKPILDSLLGSRVVPYEEEKIKKFVMRRWPHIYESLLWDVCNIISEASKEFQEKFKKKRVNGNSQSNKRKQEAKNDDDDSRPKEKRKRIEEKAGNIKQKEKQRLLMKKAMRKQQKLGEKKMNETVDGSLMVTEWNRDVEAQDIADNNDGKE